MARLYEALCFARAAKHWPVLVGDWKFGPGELRDFIDLADVKLKIVQPGNADFTCLQGRATLTSYLLVAEEMASAVDSCEAVTVAWGTHLGLRFHLSGPRASPWYRALLLCGHGQRGGVGACAGGGGLGSGEGWRHPRAAHHAALLH